MAEILVRRAEWNRDRDALQSIRCIVFIEEQQVPPALEWDGLDAACAHFLATVDGKPAGTVRITPAGQIGRMAVLPPFRRKGIGRELLECAIGYARSASCDRVFLHAQVSAISFYRDAGFVEEGEIFEEAGIEHRAMTLKIC